MIEDRKELKTEDRLIESIRPTLREVFDENEDKVLRYRLAALRSAGAFDWQDVTTIKVTASGKMGTKMSDVCRLIAV